VELVSQTDQLVAVFDRKYQLHERESDKDPIEPLMPRLQYQGQSRPQPARLGILDKQQYCLLNALDMQEGF
jgi:hypothetical protein